MVDRMEDAMERVVNRLGSTYYGKYRGIVTDVNDPENLCRIRARVSNVLDNQETGWALPASPFAGARHGLVMLPAVGSGVWIEFEAGRLDLPIWSGCWWASGQRPDPQGAKQRVIVTEAGNQVIFDDDANEVKIVHSGGPEIKISDSEIVMKVGSCELKIGASDISLNDGQIKIGLAGVSLVKGAMAFGTPP